MEDFGVNVRAHLRKAPRAGLQSMAPHAWADVVYSVFESPWKPLPAAPARGGPEDKLLCATLGEAVGGIPKWANDLVRVHIKGDRGLEVVQVVCKFVVSTTDSSDTCPIRPRAQTRNAKNV